MKKSAQRDANTARALAVVRVGHRPPAITSHRQDRLQYTAPQLASAQCNQRATQMTQAGTPAHTQSAVNSDHATQSAGEAIAETTETKASPRRQ